MMLLYLISFSGATRAAGTPGVRQLEIEPGTVGTIAEKLLPIRYSGPWSIILPKILPKNWTEG